MSIILLCLFIATLLPILSKAPLAFAMFKDGGYDNKYPRDQQSRLTGFGARAKAAHENAFEALIMFIPGALAVVATGKVGEFSQQLALAFIGARVAYHLCYLLNWHLARSISWSVGFVASVLLVWQALP